MVVMTAELPREVQRWVMRSSRAAVIEASPKTLVHRANGRFVVISVEARS